MHRLQQPECCHTVSLTKIKIMIKRTYREAVPLPPSLSPSSLGHYDPPRPSTPPCVHDSVGTPCSGPRNTPPPLLSTCRRTGWQADGLTSYPLSPPSPLASSIVRWHCRFCCHPPRLDLAKKVWYQCIKPKPAAEHSPCSPTNQPKWRPPSTRLTPPLVLPHPHPPPRRR